MRALRRTRRKASSRRVSSSSASRVQYLTRLRFEPLEGRALLSLAPVLVDLQAASDSGVFSDDNLTNVAAPTIDITAAEAGQAIRVYREGTLVGEAAQIDGTLYRYGFLSGQLAEGQNTITARSFDGVEESEDSPGLVITLDTAGPRVVGHSPEGVVGPVDFLTVTFNEPIDPATLTAADVSVLAPSLPALVGSYDTSGYAYGVAVSGTLAYVADGDSGLQIIDVSNPAAPTLRGTYNTSGYAYGVAVSGTLAYVADDDSGLQIIDVSNPAAPTLRGTYDTSGYAWGVAVSGTLAYVADDDSGLQIIDVSNPAAPTLRGTYDTSGYACGVAVSGTLAYVADDDSGLQIIDVSNPSAPTLRGTYDTSGYAEGVAVSGTLAYVADGDSGLADHRCVQPVRADASRHL